MSLPSVLSGPPVGATPARLAAAVHRSPQTEELVARERADAYREGVAAGRAEAAAAHRADVDATARQLQAVVDDQIARLAAAGDAHDRAVLAEAARLARYVVDLVDATAVDAVIDRLAAALDEVDDVDLVAHVAPPHVDAVTAAFAGRAVRVVADDAVAPGDARLVGRWSVADLGRRQRWDAVRELIADA